MILNKSHYPLRNAILILLFITLSLSINAQKQVSYGIQLGATYSIPSTVIMFDGKIEGKTDDNVGSPLLDGSYKAYLNFNLSSKKSLFITAGLEKMRFESLQNGVGEININNWGITIIQSYSIYRNLHVLVSRDAVIRRASSSNNFPIPGPSVAPKTVHFQGGLGFAYLHKKGPYVMLSSLVPRLRNVISFSFGPMLERTYVERLASFRLVIGIPLGRL